MVISQAPDNNTLVSLVILPSSGGNRRDVERTSTELVALIRQLSQNPSSASNALLQLLMPESVWCSSFPAIFTSSVVHCFQVNDVFLF